MNWFSRIKIAKLADELRSIEQIRGSNRPLSPQQRNFVDRFLRSIERVYQQVGYLSPKQQETWDKLKSQYGLSVTSRFCADCGKEGDLRGGICPECWNGRKQGT